MLAVMIKWLSCLNPSKGVDYNLAISRIPRQRALQSGGCDMVHPKVAAAS